MNRLDRLTQISAHCARARELMSIGDDGFAIYIVQMLMIEVLRLLDEEEAALARQGKNHPKVVARGQTRLLGSDEARFAKPGGEIARRSAGHAEVESAEQQRIEPPAVEQQQGADADDFAASVDSKD